MAPKSVEVRELHPEVRQALEAFDQFLAAMP